MTGIGKRPPYILASDVLRDAERMSKSDWIDLYFDLYRQTHAEDASEGEIIDDAERRIAILRVSRAGWVRQ